MKEHTTQHNNKKTKQTKKRDKNRTTDQISLIIFHLGRTDQMILLSPPVPKTSEKVIGKETVNGIPDDVDIYRLIYPEPEKKTRKKEGEHYVCHSFNPKQRMAEFKLGPHQINSDK